MASKEITLTRTFDVSRDKVWGAWTAPEQLSRWWAPHGFTAPTVELDPEVGGELYVVMLAGENLGAMSGMRAPLRGTFTEVVENERLAFTNNALDEAGNVLLSGTTEVTFEEENGKTKMTIRTAAKGTAPATAIMLAGMEQGWNEQTDKLGEFLSR
jgi:uncharacterized protein YndB with AHSA1/START domain